MTSHFDLALTPPHPTRTPGSRTLQLHLRGRLGLRCAQWRHPIFICLRKLKLR